MPGRHVEEISPGIFRYPSSRRTFRRYPVSSRALYRAYSREVRREIKAEADRIRKEIFHGKKSKAMPAGVWPQHLELIRWFEILTRSMRDTAGKQFTIAVHMGEAWGILRDKLLEGTERTPGGVNPMWWMARSFVMECGQELVQLMRENLEPHRYTGRLAASLGVWYGTRSREGIANSVWVSVGVKDKRMPGETPGAEAPPMASMPGSTSIGKAPIEYAAGLELGRGPRPLTPQEWSQLNAWVHFLETVRGQRVRHRVLLIHSIIRKGTRPHPWAIPAVLQYERMLPFKAERFAKRIMDYLESGTPEEIHLRHKLLPKMYKTGNPKVAMTKLVEKESRQRDLERIRSMIEHPTAGGPLMGKMRVHTTEGVREEAFPRPASPQELKRVQAARRRREKEYKMHREAEEFARREEEREKQLKTRTDWRKRQKQIDKLRETDPEAADVAQRLLNRDKAFLKRPYQPRVSPSKKPKTVSQPQKPETPKKPKQIIHRPPRSLTELSDAQFKEWVQKMREMDRIREERRKKNEG